MSRRRVVAIISASVMLLLGLLVLAVVLGTTQTTFGRERVQRFVNARIASAMKGRGSMYIGRISGSLFTEVVVDSFAIRDEEDSLFIATGPVHIKYDPRDIIDKRILLSYLEVNRPVVVLRRRADHQWNFRHIFPEGPKGQPPSRDRKYGDFIVMDSAVVHDATFIMTDLWSPPDSLKGARRDSAVRVALADTAHEIRRTREGLKQTRRWTRGELRSPFVRFADPDSDGKLIQIGDMSVAENDPPFRFSRMNGPVRILGDSVWFELHHFDLPASTGRATGKVWWGGDRPTNYDIRIWGDSVALADIGWVYPTLPRTGGGTMELTIRNNARDKHVLEYGITKMDLRTTKSHVLGAMTFGVGGPVLVLKDVDLRAEPVDFDLIRTFNGKPFPVNWQGQFTGYVRGPGGPLNDWQVSDGTFTFVDKNVPGATTRAALKGGLNILVPADAKFRSLDLSLATLDLRTIEFLFPGFPRLRGTMSGSATLDSIWTDVRFRNADLTHHDGDSPASRFTGDGRITMGEKYVGFDVDLQALPISFSTFALSYPRLPLRGSYTGPMRIKGTIADLQLASTLTGPAGSMSVDGRFDFDTAGGLGAHTTGSLGRLDVASLLERPSLPSTSLTGTFAADLRGDSIADLVGTLGIDLDSSRVSTVHFFPSTARLAFGDGRMHVDSLRVETNAARVSATGALGVAHGIADSLHYTVVVDSLGGLRRWLKPPPVSRGAAALAAHDSVIAPNERELAMQVLRDSLAGTLRSEGTLLGSIDTVAVRGTLVGRGLFAGGDRAERLDGAYTFVGLPSAPRGTFTARADSVSIAAVALDSVQGTLRLDDRADGRLAFTAATQRHGSELVAGADIGFQRTADSLRVTIDTLGATIASHPWRLVTPATFVFDTIGTHLDSVLVRNGGAARIRARGDFPNARPVNGVIALDSVPLGDFGALAQLRSPLAGTATAKLDVSGVRQNPVMHLDARVADMHYGTIAFPYFTLQGSYAERRLGGTLRLLREGKQILTFTGELPVDLALVPVEQRLLGDSLSGRIVGDSVDLGVIEAMSPMFSRVSGRLSTAVDLAGTWQHPVLTGRLRVTGGDMGLPKAGVQLRRLDADIGFRPDSLLIDSLAASSGTQEDSRMTLRGVVRLGNVAALSEDRRAMGFDVAMRAKDFEIVNKRTFARVELSDDLHLTGPFTRMVVNGDARVERAVIYLQELAQKNVINVDAADFQDIDTALVADRSLWAQIPEDVHDALDSLQVPNLQVTIGNDVWLRSQEANIKLGGEVNLQRSRGQRLTGSIDVERGTYRLDLGLVQRTFRVDSGTVTFYNDPQQAGTLNIYATYTVRQANQLSQDVDIIAHIQGTLRNPTLDLMSNERFALSYTEILSYLVFGQPTVLGDVGNNYLAPVAQALLPSAGALIERALTSQIGFLDYVQVQTGSTRGAAGTDQAFNTQAENFLAGSRIGIGKQIGENTFVTANAGLCSVLGQSATGGAGFGSSIGVSVEYRLSQHLSLQASSEPATSSLLCRTTVSIGSRPRQYGFDLFRDWSF